VRSTNHLAPRYAISSIPPVTSSLLGPNILLNTILSNTLSFLSSLNVSDQVSHPYKTTGKIIFILVVMDLRISFKIYAITDFTILEVCYDKRRNAELLLQTGALHVVEVKVPAFISIAVYLCTRFSSCGW